MEYEYAIKVLSGDMQISDVPIMFRDKTAELIKQPALIDEYKNKKAALLKSSEFKQKVFEVIVALLTGENLNLLQSDYKEKLADVDDTVAVYMTDCFPKWSANSVEYKKDDRVVYNGILYKVLTTHTSQESWKPDVAPSLFVKVLTSESEILEWEQPSADNAYMKGDKVRFNGKVYERLIDNNVWSPEAYPQGWQEVTNTNQAKGE